MELTPTQEKQETLAYLEYEGERWVRLRDRCQRSGNLDARLNLDRDNQMLRIDHLLEDLYRQNVMLESGS